MLMMHGDLTKDNKSDGLNADQFVTTARTTSSVAIVTAFGISPSALIAWKITLRRG